VNIWGNVRKTLDTFKLDILLETMEKESQN